MKATTVFISFAVMATTWLWASMSNCSDTYIVTFSEGFYPPAENTATELKETNDKYRAIVIVYKQYSACGSKATEIGRVRGSTLPNPYWYYTGPNGNALWKDGNLQKIFTQFRSLNLESAGLSGLSKIFDLFENDKHWPIIKSGEYSFKVKRCNHANCNNSSYYSTPCKERDKESWEKVHFLPRALEINNSSCIPTVNPNITNNNTCTSDMEADKIWIHEGREYKANRDSEGCLTINPYDWCKFLALFPDENSWTSGNNRGRVILTRSNSVYVLPAAPPDISCGTNNTNLQLPKFR